MKLVSAKSILAVALFTWSYGTSASAAFAQRTEDESAIAQLQKQYVASIDAADTDMIDRIWSHSPDVIFIEPRGTERGIEQVKKFVSDTFGKIFSKRDLNLESPLIHVYGDAAWSEMTWTFHATIRQNGAPLTTKGRETQIYRKENGAWHIVAVHYSGPPMTVGFKGF